MTVLIVDDQVDVASVFQDRIESMGHACLTARDVDEARALLETVPIDCMALDFGRPGPDALSWLEEVAAGRPDLAANTVVITHAEITQTEIARVEACGACVLEKPFTIQRLITALRLPVVFPGRFPRHAAWPSTDLRKSPADDDVL